MKLRIIFLVLWALSLSSIEAQIAIGPSDMPSTGEMIPFTSTAVVPAGVDYTLTGENMVWDYSMLVPGLNDIDTFFTVEQTPFLYQFFFNNFILYPDYNADFALPGDNFDLGLVTVTDVFNYYKNDDEAFRNVGYGANINGLPSSIRNNPIDVIYEFPLSYQSSSNSVSASELEIPGLGYYRRDQVREVEAEGWGTLILPGGSFEVLKVKSILNQLDTVYIASFDTGFTFAQPQQTIYEWIAQGESGALLTITEREGLGSTVEYRHESTVSVSEEELRAPIRVYPTVVAKELFIDGASQIIKGYAVFDIQGRTVQAEGLSGQTGAYRLSMADMSRGSYVIQLRTESQVYSFPFFKD